MSTSPSLSTWPLLTAADLAGPTDVVIGDGGIIAAPDGTKDVAITIPALGKRLILDSVDVVDLTHVAARQAFGITDVASAVYHVLDWQDLAIRLYPTPTGAIRIGLPGLGGGASVPNSARWGAPAVN